jgi:hypothetical protein
MDSTDICCCELYMNGIRTGKLDCWQRAHGDSDEWHPASIEEGIAKGIMMRDGEGIVMRDDEGMVMRDGEGMVMRDGKGMVMRDGENGDERQRGIYAAIELDT